MDSYTSDIIEETGLLFEKSQKQGYDFEDFVNKYMNSYLRENIDARHAYYATMMNYDMLDFMLNKEKLTVKHNDNPFDYILANWIGEFYSYIQARSNLSSKEILKLLPIKKLMGMVRGLHDLDYSLAYKKVGFQ